MIQSRRNIPLDKEEITWDKRYTCRNFIHWLEFCEIGRKWSIITSKYQHLY